MYNKYVEVNKKFKSSVNLEFDIKNEDKILEYVPTTDLCDVLYYYLESTIRVDTIRSTLLVGPYGKGKSYLMLMLTYLLSKRENRNLFTKVLERIERISLELANLIKEIDSKHISLLPVIINNNYADDFNQAFMIAISNALKDNNLVDLIPNSTFKEALDIIKKWKKASKAGGFSLEEYLDAENCSLTELEKGLKEYKNKYYLTFKRIFKKISHGIEFNSMISSDIANLYFDIASKLANYGYQGLFIIYDEFGVFLENQTQDFKLRLNKLQTLAEKCNNSSFSSQMHLCCVTHKDFVLYSKNKESSNDFAKIAGRFKTIKFNRSLEENYEIICDSLIKKSGYEGVCNQFISANQSFISDLEASNVLTKTEISYLLKNGFPFNPLSIYVLVAISELVGQNERTLFTFLTDNSENTFRYYCNHNDQGLLNVDIIYDYFADLIKNDELLNPIYNKVESFKNLGLAKEEVLVIKALAIFKIINDDIKLPASIANLALALAMDKSLCQSVVNSLIQENYLKNDSVSDYIDFSLIADNSLAKKIEQVCVTKLLNYKVSSLLNEINDNKYYVSNRYNYKYEMTRYYSEIYELADNILKLKDITSIAEYSLGDGLLINVLATEEEYLALADKIKEFNRPNVIFRVITKPLAKEVINKCQRLVATKLILKEKDLTRYELDLLNNYAIDLKNEISRYLELSLTNAKLLNSVVSTDSLTMMIYKTFEIYYSETVILVNEQINKNNVSTVSKKARNTVGDYLLGLKDKQFSVTSLEQTILNSFEDALAKNLRIVSSIINLISMKKDSPKISFKQIYNLLAGEPIGMRLGVMPLFIAKAFGDLTTPESAVVLYNHGQEIPVTTANIDLALLSDGYEVSYLEFARAAYDSFSDFSLKLGFPLTSNFNQIIKNIVTKLRDDFYSFDQIIAQANEKDNVLNLSELELNYKKLVRNTDLNSFALLFTKLPILFQVEPKDLPQAINEVRESMQDKAKSYYESLVKYVKNKIGTNDAISSGFRAFVTEKDLTKVVLPLELKELYTILNTSNNDDKLVITKLAYVITKANISSFNMQRDKHFKETFGAFIDYLLNYNENDVEIESMDSEDLSAMGNTLFNNLEETLNDYGDAISKEEKIKILRILLKRVG